MIPTGDVSGGLLTISVAWKQGLARSEPSIIKNLPLNDGGLVILALEDLLIVELWKWGRGFDIPLDQRITPPLLRKDWQFEVITVAWSDSKIVEFRISGQDVPLDPDMTLDLRRDLVLQKNSDTIAVSSVASALPSNIYHQLHQTTKRLVRTADAIRSDNMESLLDLAVHLRTLVTPNRRKGSLLQIAAEAAGIVPTVYTVRWPLHEDTAEITKLGFSVFDASASPVPLPGMSTEVELFKWLEGPAILTTTEEFSHIKLIKEVADKAGAHADLKISALLASLRDPNSDGFELTVLVGQMRQYAHLIGTLAKDILAAGEQAQS